MHRVGRFLLRHPVWCLVGVGIIFAGLHPQGLATLLENLFQQLLFAVAAFFDAILGALWRVIARNQELFGNLALTIITIGALWYMMKALLGKGGKKK